MAGVEIGEVGAVEVVDALLLLEQLVGLGGVMRAGDLMRPCAGGKACSGERNRQGGGEGKSLHGVSVTLYGDRRDGVASSGRLCGAPFQLATRPSSTFVKR